MKKSGLIGYAHPGLMEAMYQFTNTRKDLDDYMLFNPDSSLNDNKEEK